MAEFQEVMRQWKRMCMAMDKKAGDGESCALCPLEECGAIYEMSQNHDWEEDAEKIMSWAAQNQEPVYPTWREYLQEQGVLDVEYIPAASSTTSTSKSYVQTVKTLAPFYRPIPADSAEKLGIEPKNG